MYIVSVLAQANSPSTNSVRGNFLSEACVLVPAGAGEFVQGQLSSGEDFLVTNPVRLFSKVHVAITPGSGLVTVSPFERTKAKQAVIETLRLFDNREIDVAADVRSEIQPGKGLGSSTADIVGAVEATTQAIGRSITPEQVSDIAVSIEPSDGLMYRGVVLYNHRCGYILEHLGDAPDLRQLIVDTGGSVDTIAFNKIPKHYTREEIEVQGKALDLVREGIRSSNITKIGEGSTMSARVNQRILPKANFEVIVRMAEEFGATGVACAHSGTILSLLFTPENVDGLENARAAFQSMCCNVMHTRSITTW